MVRIEDSRMVVLSGAQALLPPQQLVFRVDRLLAGFVSSVGKNLERQVHPRSVYGRLTIIDNHIKFDNLCDAQVP